jgi:tRNA (guanine37-N1)-methyltransferase
VKKIWVLTLFPQSFESLKTLGVVGQALSGQRGVSITLETVQLRDYSPSNYKGVDDAPYGGGKGMVIRADVLQNALLKGVMEAGGYEDLKNDLHVVYASPRGRVWDNDCAKSYAQNYLAQESHKDLVFICGRYEGIDQRFIDLYVDEEVSIGDFVISGGELAVSLIIDSSLRFMPGVLGKIESTSEESFQEGLLEHSQYTRPQVFEGLEVPKVLLSGNHQKIAEHKRQEKEKITKKRRPDLWQKVEKE